MMQCQLTDLKDLVQHRLAIKSVCIFVGLIIAFLLGAPMDVSSVCAAALLLVWANRPPREALEKVDWSLLLFFAGLFVMVAGFVKAEAYLLEGWYIILGTEIGLRTLTLFSTANVIVAQGAQQKADLRFRDFLLAGIPVTLVTTTIGVLMLWLFDLLRFI